MDRIPIPFSAQIEITEGCQNRCIFCGIHSIRGKKHIYKFMTLELAKQIAQDLNRWMPQGRRIEFALQGEPTLNPNTEMIILAFRKYYPKSQLMMNTNGIALHKNDKIDHDMLNRYFGAGLNYLLIDVYDNSYKWWVKNLKQSRHPVEEYHKGFNVYKYIGPKKTAIVLMDNYSTDAWGKTVTRNINNQAGNMPIAVQKKYGVYITEPLKKNCSNVHREIVVKHDGVVPAGCMDWRRQLIIGKFPDKSLKQIWESDKFQAVRQMLYNKDRAFAPCNVCSYSGYKLGLIKDPGVNKSREELLKIIEDE